ncbi:MAG: hypothetical protein U0790_20560 [Isosphaeraceae bacterium]
MVILGVGAIGYSLITDHELGVVRLISMPAYLAMDGASGLVLALLAWLVESSTRVWTPHIIPEHPEVAAAAATQSRPACSPVAASGMGRAAAPRI